MRKNRTNKIVDFEFPIHSRYFKRLFNMIQILQICNLNKYRIRSCDLFIKCGVLSAGFHNISHGYGKSKVQWSPVKCKIGHRHMFLHDWQWCANGWWFYEVAWSRKQMTSSAKVSRFVHFNSFWSQIRSPSSKTNMIANSNILNVGPHKITTNVNGWNENSYVLHKVGITTIC